MHVFYFVVSGTTTLDLTANSQTPTVSFHALFRSLEVLESSTVSEMSLFSRITGPNTSSAPSATSVFAQAAGSKPANAGGSVFGAPAPQAGFGNTGNMFASAAAPTATTAAPQAGFGNTGNMFASAAAPTATTAAPQAAGSQPANAGGNLFGAPATQAASGNAGNMFASVAALTATNAAPQPAYFDALLQRGKKRPTASSANGLGELPQLQLGLQDISRKVRNLGRGGPSSALARGADARAHYLLSASGVNASQALRDLEDLADSGTTQAQPTVPQQLTFDTGIQQSLAQKYQYDFQNMVDSHIRKSQDDFNKMVEENLRGVDWEAHRERIYEHFGLKKPGESNGSAMGGAAKTEAGSFGRSSRRNRHGTSVGDKSFGISGMSKSVIGTPGPKGAKVSAFGDIADRAPSEGFRSAADDRALRIKQEHYASRVKDLNLARLQEKPFPILSRFAEVESEPSTDDNAMLVHAYNALVRITGEDPSQDNVSNPGAVKARQLAQSYLDDNPNSAAAIQIRKRILCGSRQFLEAQHLAHVETTVGKNPREANIGGIPTPLAKIKGYVRVRAARKELGPDFERLIDLDGDLCWAVIFYMLRSGLVEEALQYVEAYGAAFMKIDRAFMRYLRLYAGNEERRLPSKEQNSISNEYSQRIRLAPEDSLDPYRMMCYKVIGRCDLQKKSLDGFSTDMMDWLWLQFALAREYSRVDEFAHEAYGLEELRNGINQIGERYFGPGNNIANAPTTLFFMQILAGMFEKAVADLYPHNYISATHFAIALGFYGLLRVSDINNSEDLLTYTTRQQTQIAFGSLVGLYTQDFRTADATAAVDYICLICLNSDLGGEPGKRQRELCHQALTEIVLETREFAQLLGDVRSDGLRIKGTIEQRLRLIGLESEADFLKHITLVAARTAEEHSRVTDAALLFHLSEDYDKVIQVVNEAMSVSMTTELGEQPTRLTPLKPRNTDGQNHNAEQPQQSSLSLTALDDPILLARNMMSLYNSGQMYYSKLKDQNRHACMTLLRLADARQALEQHDWPLTIDVSLIVSQPPLFDVPLTSPLAAHHRLSASALGDLGLHPRHPPRRHRLQPAPARCRAHCRLRDALGRAGMPSKRGEVESRRVRHGRAAQHHPALHPERTRCHGFCRFDPLQAAWTCVGDVGQCRRRSRRLLDLSMRQLYSSEYTHFIPL